MKKGKIIIILCISVLFCVGAGSSVTLVTTQPIINFDVLAVDSPGINPVDNSNADEDAIEEESESETIVNEIKNEFTIKVRGKNVFFDNQMCQSMDDLNTKINEANIKSSSTIYLIDNYADYNTFNAVFEMVDGRCDIKIEQLD